MLETHTDNCKNAGKTWSDFMTAVKGKKVIIYGIGYCISQFFEHYGNKILVDYIIDNNMDKQGVEIGNLVPAALHSINENIIITKESILDQYNPEEVIVLIASTKRYKEIAVKLEQRGYNNYFIIPLLKDYIPDTSWLSRENIKNNLVNFAEECTKLPIQLKKVVFSSYKNYEDHEKYISNALLKLRQDLDIVWIVSTSEAKLPEGVRGIQRNKFKDVIYEMETAAMWISDESLPDYLKKRKEQIYIQTKHWASITLKKFYLDADTFKNTPEKIALWKRESEIIDYIIVGSEFDKESCKRGFQFNKEFIMAGSPRSDGLFFEKENKEKVHSFYGIKAEKHILMYAPTYRFDKEKGKNFEQSREIGFDYEKVKAILEKRFGGEWLIALRLHPSVAASAKDMQLPDFVFDVSMYEDSEELVSASDVVISDFSSLMFEPAFVKKPVFLYTTDLEDYIKNEYELLIDYRELPFDIAESSDELCNKILEFDKQKYDERVEFFLEKYGVHEDGHASERAAAFISDLIDKGE